AWRSWDDEKLAAVIAHELTHVDRHDFFVMLAAEFNRCLYWFHPASWWLRRQLADLAEEACDDAAIEQTGDPAGYARHVLEIASLLSCQSGRPARLSVSMARESNVESRIAMILDFQRPLTRKLKWPAAVAITTLCLLAVVSAAALRPVGAVEPDDGVDSAVSDNDSKDTEETAADAVPVRGQVLDQRGNPVSEARARVYRIKRAGWYAAPQISTLVAELDVDAEGRFDQSIPAAKLAGRARGEQSVLMISAPGFAHQSLVADPPFRVVNGKTIYKPDFAKQTVTVKLWPEVDVQGRLLSIEGQPVEDDTVSVYQMRRADPKRLDQWIKRAEEKPLVSNEANRMIMMGGPPAGELMFPNSETMWIPQSFVEPVKTDGKGQFRIPGVSENDVVVLRISGPGITNTMIHVLGRDRDPVYARHVINMSYAGAYHGRHFEFITQPSLPVFGVVHDIETKAPLADVPVAIGSVYGARMSHTGYVVTRTDEQGRYRIEGLPIPPRGTRKWDRNSLSIRPGKLPYIENDNVPIPVGDGISPVEFNVGLRRAVIAKGRIINKVTGEPVQAELHYSPFQTNEHNEKYLRYADDLTTMLGNDTRYKSDQDGNFEIPVIPGRGVLAAKCPDATFVAGYGSKAIKEFQGEKRGFGRSTSDHVIPTSYHALREIDVPADADSFAVDLQVDPGISLTVKFVDPDGKPLKGVRGYGLKATRAYGVFDQDRTEAHGLAVGEVRPIGVDHPDRKLSLFYRLIPQPGQTEVTLKLLPESKLRGRLVDTEGRPLADVVIEARHNNDPVFMSSLQQIVTDKDGRFEYMLRSGTNYTLIGRTDKFITVAKDMEIQTPQSIDSGDLTVDADADRWAEVKPKREPVVEPLETE
ncbi:MAG: M56 family metallopeptidase, partial [Pirellulales bacterium]|nr:M56 family metallopeptidase [Pirellulales bacterium]